MSPPDHSDQLEFSRFIDCGKLPSGGKTFEIEANASERKLLEKRLSIDSLDHLTADFSVTPRKGEVITLKGRLTATIRQSCVISLKPVITDINVAIDRIYSLTAESQWGEDGEPDEYGYLSGGGQTKDLPEPPEALVNGGIDLGEVASEELAVEIDPFPRLPGAELKVSGGLGAGHQGEQAKNPFAVLEKLKKKLE